jgi:hypothetical protein
MAHNIIALERYIACYALSLQPNSRGLSITRPPFRQHSNLANHFEQENPADIGVECTLMSLYPTEIDLGPGIVADDVFLVIDSPMDKALIG